MKWFFKTWLGRAIIAIFVGGVALASVGGPASLDDLKAEQERYFNEHGRYQQILKSGDFPTDKAPDRVFDLGKVPSGTWVNVYDGPEGKGYQVVQEFSDRIEYTGFGPQADDYTFTRFKPVTTASST